MKKNILLIALALVLSLSIKAQIPTLLIGLPKKDVIKEMKKQYPKAEYTEESTKAGEKFSSFFVRDKNLMFDCFFGKTNNKCYEADCCTSNTDFQLMRTSLNRDNILITNDICLTKDKNKKNRAPQRYRSFANDY